MEEGVEKQSYRSGGKSERDRKRGGKEEQKGRKERAKEEEELRNRLERIERKLEMKERNERKKNIIIKELEVREEKRREAVKKVLEEIEAKVKVVEIWRAGREASEEREMVGVKFAGEEQKKEILRKKGALRGRRKRISENWTWRERKMTWSLEVIARKEERKGNRTWISFGRIRINEEWWKWEEEREVLRDIRGKERNGGGEMRKGKGQKKEMG